MALRANTAVLFIRVTKCRVCCLILDVPCWWRGYGCLYLNPRGEPVQCAEIPWLSCPARSVTCWPRNHHSNVRFGCPGLQQWHHWHSPPSEVSRNKENIGAMSSELPLHYIHGDNKDRRQTEETKAEYFSQLLGVARFYSMGLLPHHNPPLSPLMTHPGHSVTTLCSPFRPW
jgi:hypothetical protein